MIRVQPAQELARSIDLSHLKWQPNGAGPGRTFAWINQPKARLSAFELFGLSPRSKAALDDLVGQHIGNGTFTHMHKDQTPEGLVHIRVNVAIELPLKGGMPITGDKTLSIKTGDAWLVLASQELHGSTPAYGGRRLFASFGGLFPLSTLELFK